MDVRPSPAERHASLLADKRTRLHGILRDFGGVMVAFSGGVDSAYLLAAAHDALGARCVGATAVSPSLARDELRIARRIARRLGARHVLVQTREFEDARYTRNDPHRCYFCKHALFTELQDLAADLGLPYVAYGANADDLGDYRPGARAAAEFSVRAPLVDAELTKQEIRTLARERGIEVWDKPASPCLSSRLPFGSPVTLRALAQIEQSERVLHRLGFPEVRVRHHGESARIEVPLAEMPRLAGVLPEVEARLQALGFRHVTVAQDGLRSGRLTAGRVSFSADPATSASPQAAPGEERP
jgi:uncharacterized protein